MKTDDHPSEERLSKKDDPCLRRDKMLGKYLDLMVFSRELKPEVLEDIRKTHGLLIPQRLHILHNMCLLVFLLHADSS